MFVVSAMDDLILCQPNFEPDFEINIFIVNSGRLILICKKYNK